MNVNTKIILPIIFISLMFLNSCTIQQNTQNEQLIKQNTNVTVAVAVTVPQIYFEIYTNNEQSLDHLNIEAILKTFVSCANKTNYSQWIDFNIDENNYISLIYTNYIHPDYPIIASTNDIVFSDGFLDALSCYYESQNRRTSDSIPDLTAKTKNLIILINNFEYENRKLRGN